MPDKTHGELIRELLGLVASHAGRLDAVKEDLKLVRERLDRTSERVATLETKIAIHEQQIGDLREEKKEWARRLWMIAGPLVGAVIGSLLTYLLRK